MLTSRLIPQNSVPPSPAVKIVRDRLHKAQVLNTEIADWLQVRFQCSKFQLWADLTDFARSDAVRTKRTHLRSPNFARDRFQETIPS